MNIAHGSAGGKVLRYSIITCVPEQGGLQFRLKLSFGECLFPSCVFGGVFVVAIRTRIMTLLIATLLVGLPAHLLGLDEFREAVEAERADAEEEEESDDEESNDESEDDGEENEDSEDSDNGESLGSVLVYLTIGLWNEHNSRVTYSSYPYDASGPGPAVVERNFIYNIPRSPLGSDSRNGVAGREKGYWFEVAAAGLGSGLPAPPADLRYGGFASLQGRIIPHFGPDLDTRVIVHGDEELWISTAGVDISIAQHDYFSLSMYGKAAFMRGIIDMSGATLGLQLRSYPFSPISLQVRGGFQGYEGITFGQVEGRLNVHLGRFAIFAGGMFLQSDTAHLHTIESGISLTF